VSAVDTAAEPGTGRAPRRGRRGKGEGQRQSVAGWLFVTPTLVVLGLFLVGWRCAVAVLRFGGEGVARWSARASRR